MTLQYGIVRWSLILTLFFALQVEIISQDKYDYVWMFAANPIEPIEAEAYTLDFNGGKRIVTPFYVDDEIGLNNASICDADGNLMLYANGCAIYDSTFQVVENGYNINPGEVHDDWCQLGDYPDLGLTLFLEDPAGDGVYYIHKNIVNTPTDVTNPDLMYSYISYDGLIVTEKNVKIDSIRLKQSGYLEAIRHSNGKDWWIFDFVENSEGGYLAKFILDDSGIFLFNDSPYPNIESLDAQCSAAGQSCFSPDGTKYARYCHHTGLDVFDFDRESGELSQYRHLPLANLNSGFSGLAISPNGRFVYVTGQATLTQIDLWEEDLADGIFLIDTYDGIGNPFATWFTWMQIGPDCRIYVTSSNGVKSMHVINNPDEKGTACNFVQRGLQFPSDNNVGSIPNHPVFRLDGDEVCDPTITSVFDIPVEVAYDLDIYPNPTSNLITIDFPEDLRDGVLNVKSINGQVMIQQEFEYSGSLQVELGNYDAGIYLIEVISNGKYYRDRVIKVD